MKKRFDEHRDGHDEHDAITYAIHEDTLMRRFNENKDMIVNRVTYSDIEYQSFLLH